MTHTVIILSYKVPLDKIMEWVPAHRKYLEDFYQRGVILFSGIQCSQTGGIIIMRTSNEREVENLISGDPFCLENLASYETISFEARAWQPFLEEWLEKIPDL